MVTHNVSAVVPVGDLQDSLKGIESQKERIYRAALWYVERNIPLLPADSKARLPGKQYGEFNYRKATTDVGQVEEWFHPGTGRFAGWNLSLPTGPGSGIVVVDIDNKNGKDGSSVFADLMSAYGDIPSDCLMADTPSGGIHIFFAHVPGFRSTNPTDEKPVGLAPGIDTRGERREDVGGGDGGHVLIYPSVKSGKRYKWRGSPNNRLNPPPAWISDLIKGIKPVPAETGLELPEVIPEGGRDSFLYNYGLRLVARGYDNEEVETHMRRAGDRFDPPDPAMVEEKIRAVFSSEVKKKAEQVQEMSAELVLTEKGGIKKCLVNIYAIIQSNLFRSKVPLYYDEFRRKLVHNEKPNLNKDQIVNIIEYTFSDRPFMMDGVRGYIKDHIEDISKEVAQRDTLQEYFGTLQWDGHSRLPALCSQLNVDTDSLQATYIRKWLLSGVARAMVPGCKADCILVLCGAQGIGKSMFFRFMTPYEKPTTDYMRQEDKYSWFTDAVGKDQKLSHPDEIRKMKGKFIGEMAEMHAMNKNEITAIKHFLSEQRGEFVEKYKEDVSEMPRRCILGGTSNRYDYLGDETGNRRFWNISLDHHVIDQKWVYENRDQIWAEALTWYNDGGEWWLTEDEMRLQAAHNKGYEAEDAWFPVITEWASTKSHFYKDQVLSEALGFELQQMKQPDQMRVGKCLARSGFEVKQVLIDGKKRRVMINPDDKVAAEFRNPNRLYEQSSDEDI